MVRGCLRPPPREGRAQLSLTVNTPPLADLEAAFDEAQATGLTVVDIKRPGVICRAGKK